MKSKKNLKKLPDFKSDREAEKFVDSADLTDFDLSELKPTKFEFQKKGARINMRLPYALLEEIKSLAEEKQMPYTRYIREVLETQIAKEKR